MGEHVRDTQSSEEKFTGEQLRAPLTAEQLEQVAAAHPEWTLSVGMHDGKPSKKFETVIHTNADNVQEMYDRFAREFSDWQLFEIFPDSLQWGILRSNGDIDITVSSYGVNEAYLSWSDVLKIQAADAYFISLGVAEAKDTDTAALP